ncbi:hypothetical protein K505DRAFT_376542 [Melanomma pulvis-pyrius CBS 109.77]|uniref:P-loop containing nucleoside triphosphate hydrolase protein n=1 Tax=Melanomma pulvis-pyrius CBS 109.77 TaxID=1314802 RepID=A0A6A6X6M4_9PLEO|nr:hypothetical protein K505DRAFT_376542 [Melanomma pulvis-pyrius CBS 109.77]
MARRNRARRNNGANPRVPPGKGMSRAPPGNAHFKDRLDNNSGEYNKSVDEMNSHLMERFNGPHASDDAFESPDPDRLTTSAPNQVHDIQQYFADAKKPVTGGPWIEKPELPTPSEILPASDFHFISEKIIDVDEELRPNKTEGAYESTEEYLGTQYDLLREDSLRPLREAVGHVRDSPWLDEAEYPHGSSIGIYEPVHIVSVVFSFRGLAARVAFSLGRVKKHVRWEQSKRLITGTLVALSPADDCFQNKCVLATVAARPQSALDQNPPEIDLFFARPDDFEIDPMKKWIMVESRRSFFEASRHTLMALQHMMREPFPLSEHLVQARKEVEPPAYVQNNPYTDMSPIVTMEESDNFQNVNILREWPSSNSHGLDSSQSRALKRILSHRLAIVQGPPGTGKTYVSVIALEILLANMRKDDPPIIVTCQTNHALDQLLRHIAEFEPNFIRLGGRSKDTDKVKKRTLFEVRSGVSLPKSNSSHRSQAVAEMRKLTTAMQMLLAPLEANKPPLDHRVLVKLRLLTDEQAESLEDEAQQAMGISPDTPGIQMEQWLGKCLTPCLRPLQPDDFGMEFEEEDFEVEQLKELEAEANARDDENFETLRGPVTLLSDNWRGKGGSSYLRTDDEIRDLLKRTGDLTTIPVSDRGVIYNYFHRETKRLILVEFRKLARNFEHACLRKKVGQWEQDFRLLKPQRLIGMTTTGLSKYRGLIASLKPRVVLVEEAAETLEAPVTVACLPSLEHLILVGDHQQLRPHCQVPDLENDPYNFNLSLFERMVHNDVQIDCLSRQRRMIPEIRRLLQPIYGTSLKDHPNVQDVSNRPPVEGMGGCNSFFFTHEWPESRDANMSSSNDKEADMVVGFFDYLVLNGVDPSKITILTFYHGQRKAIHKKLKQNANLKIHTLFNVVTVDSYQGEENDIVLLSLVRSNKRHNIGFLSVDNRVCVALSRAKRGFYIFGNAEMLACESGTWSDVVDIMYGKGKNKTHAGQKRRVGYQFPLECANHGHKTWIEDPSDWDLIHGGCDEKCRCRLPCGHTCVLKCHPFSSERINCTQKCLKRVEPCNHPCTAMCCDPCKCQFCDQNSNGLKGMLKHAPKGGAAPRPKPPAFQSPAPPSQTTEQSGSTPGQWRAYANGGARVHDAEAIKKMQEEYSEYMEGRVAPSGGLAATLVDISPVKGKGKASENTDLLIDSEFQPQTRVRIKEQFSYADAAKKNKKKNKPVDNLLD